MNRPTILMERGNLTPAQAEALTKFGFNIVFVHDVEGVRSIGEVPLRDYFAAKALQGMRACANTIAEPEKVATWAYEDADAMLVEREKAK